MTLFLATHANKIDAKNRVSVPSGFRHALAGHEFQGVVLVPSTKYRALDGFSMTMMHDISARLDRFDLFSDTQDDLATTLFANAVPLAFDETGRITMPRELLAHAGIVEGAVFVGLGTKFQIWEPAAFAARQKQAATAVQKNSLTIPRGEGA
jgi:MraZ protein